MISLLVIFLLSPLAVSGMYQPPRVNMIQRQACYFVPFEKELTCQCTGQDTNTFLSLKLMFFIKEKGQEVRLMPSNITVATYTLFCITISTKELGQGSNALSLLQLQHFAYFRNNVKINLN